ncbi:MAG: Sister chromatid cohesion protein 2 [Peltula sp. TS41687]|nr:MAG: Sister chromatid cohesion protein 2 [Peltula sp. TS41687]
MKARRAQSFPYRDVLGHPRVQWMIVGNSVAQSVSLALAFPYVMLDARIESDLPATLWGASQLKHETQPATQLLEEIWIPQFSFPTEDDHETLQRRLAMRDEVSLIRRTLQRSGNTSTALGPFLQGILSENLKNSAANIRVCKDMVAVMSNEIINSEDQSEHTTKQVIMQALTVFAKANAMLFSAKQLEHLQIYIGHLSHNEDLHMFRSVVVVFR